MSVTQYHLHELVDVVLIKEWPPAGASNWGWVNGVRGGDGDQQLLLSLVTFLVFMIIIIISFVPYTTTSLLLVLWLWFWLVATRRRE